MNVKDSKVLRYTVITEMKIQISISESNGLYCVYLLKG